jgi:tetratricopeptide (TPR) repeat protein
MLLCLLAPSAWAKKPKPPSAVADLRFGVALYHYYQGQHLDALAELLVAQSRGGIAGHADQPQIMAGGFYMAYGMERTASALFSRLLNETHSAKTRDAVWFYLARMRYAKADWAGVQAALANISPTPEFDLAQDILALRLNLATRQDDIASAESLLKQVDSESTWLPYLYFNLGSAYGRKANFAAAVDRYNRLLHMRLTDEESLSLYDKAMTSAGYGYLFAKQYQEAMDQFKQVRLQSPVSNKALLGYGWAAAESGNYPLAIKPWERLAQAVLVDESAQESLVAVPYAYEKLGRKKEALAAYQQAQSQYQAAIDTLGQTLGQLEGSAISELLNLPLDDDFSWSRYAADQNFTPHKAYLATLFAQENFQAQVSALRDLLAMRRQFIDWQGRMQHYQDLVDARDLNRDQQVNGLNKQPFPEQIAQLQAQRDRLAQHLAQAISHEDGQALLSGKAAEHHLLLQAAQRRAARLQGSGQPLGTSADKLRLLSGLHLWDAQEVEAAQRVALQNQLKEADAQLASLSATWERTRSEANTGKNFQTYRSRISAARHRIDGQLKAVDQAILENKLALRGHLEQALKHQRARITQYQAQTRLSIARLLDEATGEKY